MAPNVGLSRKNCKNCGGQPGNGPDFVEGKMKLFGPFMVLLSMSFASSQAQEAIPNAKDQTIQPKARSQPFPPYPEEARLKPAIGPETGLIGSYAEAAKSGLCRPCLISSIIAKHIRN